MFEIMAEFVNLTDQLQAVQPAVSIFAAHARRRIICTTCLPSRSRGPSDAGFTVISGGGRASWRQQNEALSARAQRWAQYHAAFEQAANTTRILRSARHFFARK